MPCRSPHGLVDMRVINLIGLPSAVCVLVMSWLGSVGIVASVGVALIVLKMPCVPEAAVYRDIVTTS